MTPAQCRAARECTNLSITELAAAARVPIASLCDFECGIAPHLRDRAEIDAIQNPPASSSSRRTGMGPE